jgi:hypothetical protein
VTAEQRDQVRAVVERTCAEQGVQLQVPADVARAVAAMIVAGQSRSSRGGLYGNARSSR